MVADSFPTESMLRAEQTFRAKDRTEPPICGACIHFYDTDPWIGGATLCHQPEGHDGPHDGVVSWTDAGGGYT